MADVWTERRSGSRNDTVDDPRVRTPYEKDKGRIIHCFSFRRLQSKTQVFNLHENDFSRTRLTHTLEVAQIATGIVRTLEAKYEPEQTDYKRLFLTLLENQHFDVDREFREEVSKLLPSLALIESICLVHDIGHAPYGHSGEYALNKLMYNHGQFEGNAQTLRCITKLENYTTFGLDLTRRTLLGVIKYPTLINKLPKAVDEKSNNVNSFIPNKGIYLEDKDVFDWILEPLSPEDKKLFTSIASTKHKGKTYKRTIYKSLDCSIMELADDIAYSVADIEDAVKLRVVNYEDWSEFYSGLDTDTKKAFELLRQYSNLLPYDFCDVMFKGNTRERKKIFTRLIKLFVNHVYLVKQGKFQEPLLDYKAEVPEFIHKVISSFKQFFYRYILLTQSLGGNNNKGQNMIQAIFNNILANPALLGRKKYYLYSALESEEEKYRFICDYISCMTNDAVDAFYNNYIR